MAKSECRMIKGQRLMIEEVLHEDGVVGLVAELLEPPPPKGLGDDDEFTTGVRPSDGGVTVVVSAGEEKFCPEWVDLDGRRAMERDGMDVFGEGVGNDVCDGAIAGKFR